MWNQILYSVEQIFVSAAVAAVTAVIGVVGRHAISFITLKETALVAKMGVDKYNAQLSTARECWGIVDEFFRIHPELTKSIDTAAVKFEDELLKKVPGLTPDEINHLRQAVAGEVNKGKTAVVAAQC